MLLSLFFGSSTDKQYHSKLSTPPNAQYIIASKHTSSQIASDFVKQY